MALEVHGERAQVDRAVQWLKSKGVVVKPIEKNDRISTAWLIDLPLKSRESTPRLRAAARRARNFRPPEA